MRERATRLPQIWDVLKSGVVRHVEPGSNTGLDKYRVVGCDADGRSLKVVVNLDETGEGRVIVITVFEFGGPGGRA